jgi:aspartate carbamoyltransferase catalytic subunit
MILGFEITYGRYLNDSVKIFREVDEKHEVVIPRQLSPEHFIEIEDKTNEISSERKGEINIVDVNYKLELNETEKEKCYCHQR